ncbi:hypothetical protein EKO27_g9161 [Xylaria grammica]|uniref:Myb-like domain-containing protein n=1 Tax=Xylaria grammica TaxID=363999 RepID=A0A439CUX9_9PEZI|nr:hypothetical protein EKO27_g9161 [Xylaria grammica]
MPKWDDKSERDLLVAMRMAESGANSVTKETWVKAASIMNQMGYNDSTSTGISQRWTKVIQKNFQSQYPQALGNANGTAAAPAAAAGGTTPSPAATPRRRAKAGKKNKRAPVSERDVKDDDTTDAEDAATPSKKQKTQA